jgi:hypothetical protein
MKIKWNVKDVILWECSVRARKIPETGHEQSYTVIKFGQKRSEKRAALVFCPVLQENVGEGLSCKALQGEISFGVGSTFLVAKKIISHDGHEPQHDTETGDTQAFSSPADI